MAKKVKTINVQCRQECRTIYLQSISFSGDCPIKSIEFRNTFSVRCEVQQFVRNILSKLGYYSPNTNYYFTTYSRLDKYEYDMDIKTNPYSLLEKDISLPNLYIIKQH